MLKFKHSWLQIILCIAIPVIMLLVNTFVIVNRLSINSIPIDDTITSEDFANLYSAMFNVAFWTCIIMNIVMVLSMVFLNMNSRVIWVIYLLINLIVPCTFLFRFNINFPSDTSSMSLMALMYFGMYFLTFFVSSIFTCPDYKHFNPVACLIRR